jgi:CubicO group peptidase (beta-lactamase class C family)
MRLWILCAVYAVACEMGAAQASDEAAVKVRLDQVASSYSEKNAFMGTVLVAKSDRILLSKGYGMASLEWEIPNAPDVKFRLGSMTKQFTATLILLLQEEGKLNIDDPVSKYLPDTPKAWGKITLAELLGHTSGIPEVLATNGFSAWSMSPHTPEEELALVRDKPLDFDPGSRFSYSNSNFVALGLIAEKVSGKKYSDLLRERILDPLAMKDTGLDVDGLILPKRAEGYLPGEDSLVSATGPSMSIPWAAGSMYSTTGDLLKWEHALFGGKVLSAASLKRMTTPGKSNYGLGLSIATKDQMEVIEHGGIIPGFTTYLSYTPERGVVVVVLSNVMGLTSAALADELLEVVLGDSVMLPSERKTPPIAQEALAKFVGAYDVSPAYSLTIARSRDGLTAQGTDLPPITMSYLGEKSGHPRFLVSVLGDPQTFGAVLASAEIEFVPDSNGSIASLIIHADNQNIPAKRR